MNLDKKFIISNIQQLDIFVEDIEPEEKIVLTIVGGAAFILLGYTERSTTDIDAFMNNYSKDELLPIEFILGNELTETIEDSLDMNRLIERLETKDNFIEISLNEVEILNLIIRTPSLEVLVLTKLIASMDRDPKRNDRDFNDISSHSIKENIDLMRMEEIINIWIAEFGKPKIVEKFKLEYKRWTDHHNIKNSIS